MGGLEVVDAIDGLEVGAINGLEVGAINGLEVDAHREAVVFSWNDWMMVM